MLLTVRPRVRCGCLIARCLVVWLGCGTFVTHAEAQARLTVREGDRDLYLESALCDLERPARRYMYTWTSVLGALLVVQGSLALSTGGHTEGDRAARTGYILGAAMSGVGLTIVLASRAEAYGCRRILKYPDATSEERLARLHAAERALSSSAQATRRQTAWWMHGLGIVLGAAMGLGLGFGYEDNLLRATVQGLGTVAFMELRIWTRPTKAIAYARRYPP